MTAKAKQMPPVVSEENAAASEVMSLLAEMVGKHGMSLGAVLAGARRAIGRVQRGHPVAGIDLAAAPVAGQA